MATASDVKRALRVRADGVTATNLARFFQTEPGGYGEGDRFLGLRVPQVRSVAERYSDLSNTQIRALMRSRFHEDRFCALAILTSRFQKPDADRAGLWRLYLELLDEGGINNWDLVDATAPHLGQFLVSEKNPMTTIRSLIKSRDLWHQRVGVMVTWAFIKKGDLEPTFTVCEYLIDHPHALIHKASGWMFREAGKRNIGALREFLELHHREMPRSMLRYAIEKMAPAERARWRVNDDHP